MKLIVAVMFVVLAFVSPAKADNVGMVFGLTAGFFLAGPPGAIIGAIIGSIYGRPGWGYRCNIDNDFHRRCRSYPPRGK
jgi:hypothetical protein